MSQVENHTWNFLVSKEKNPQYDLAKMVINKVANRFVIANFPMYFNHNSFDLNMDK